ncbi:hypothetical protein [Streptomyces sp. NPDC005438]|uniref:hypothetical protein n=1 Tax=Streptomyces sp. NPDC005438 TaxID=3156880 RepID=UPI0033AD2D2E
MTESETGANKGEEPDPRAQDERRPSEERDEATPHPPLESAPDEAGPSGEHREEGGGPVAPDEPGGPEGTGTAPVTGGEASTDTGTSRRREPTLPEDEEAAWAAIVAGYGPEPADPPGFWQPDPVRDASGTADRKGTPTKDEPASGSPDEGTEGDRAGQADSDSGGESDATDRTTAKDPGDAGDASGTGDTEGTASRSFTVYKAGGGPRDWKPRELSEDEEEGHFVPPEPPPLPQTDVTTRFAWIAVLGGPLLLFGCILLQQPMTWWIVTLGLGGFLGGFGTLVARMGDDDEDDDDPGRGAVV